MAHTCYKLDDQPINMPLAMALPILTLALTSVTEYNILDSLSDVEVTNDASLFIYLTGTTWPVDQYVVLKWISDFNVTLKMGNRWGMAIRYGVLPDQNHWN